MLKHLQGAAVRIGGGSGSFVSTDGLGQSPIAMSARASSIRSARARRTTKGTASTRPPPPTSCPAMASRCSSCNARKTSRPASASAIKPGASPEEAEAAHKAIVAAIEKESYERTGLQSDVVTLFGGARYDLYQYKKISRRAPRLCTRCIRRRPSAATRTNFEFSPLRSRYLLLPHLRPRQAARQPRLPEMRIPPGPRWMSSSSVVGHPGASQRLATIDDLEFQRDVRLPYAVNELERL